MKRKTKGKRKVSAASLRALAKAHRKAGRADVAAKLEARASRSPNPSGTRKPRKATKARKRRSRNPAKTAPATAAAPAKRKKPRKRTTTTTTTQVRTVNPRRTKRKSRKASKRRSSGRSVGVGLKVTGKGKKKQLKASVGALRAATKGTGARYLDLRTGKLLKLSQAGRRSPNPSIGTGGILAIGAGVVVGAGMGEIVYRIITTRAAAFGETENAGGWYGRSAATRIAANSGKCLAAVGVLGLVVSGLGFALLGWSPIGGGFILGVGLGHIAVVAKRGALALVAMVSKVEKGNERNLGNRVAPEYAPAVQDALMEQIKTDDGRPQISESTKDGEIDMGSMDYPYDTTKILPWNLTPNQLPESNAGDANKKGGTLPGLAGTVADRIKAARERAAAAGGNVNPDLAALRGDLAGPGAKDYLEAFGAPAVGCGEKCNDPSHPCDECKEKEAKKAAAAAPPQLPAPGLSSLPAPRGPSRRMSPLGNLEGNFPRRDAA